jgi:glycosyltransferase involved in cell wall biosynthesis
MSPAAALTLCYFGADRSWEILAATGFRRRNTWLLKALSEHPEVGRVFNVRWALRAEFFKTIGLRWRHIRAARGKVEDVFLCSLLPERLCAPLFRPINRLLYPIQFAAQTGRWPRRDWVVWSYWPEGFRFASTVNLPGTWVFDADHDLVHDENRSAGDEAKVETTLRAAIDRCDLIVAASRFSLQWFAENGARVVQRVRNGAPTARTQPPAAGAGQTPRIGYVGVFSNWVDYNLLTRLAAARPDWNFVLAGPAYRASLPAELTQLPNVELLGEVQPDDLPSLLATFDVALALYRCEPWLDVDSMKLYDYLAAGVPAVSTRCHAALESDFDELIAAASTVPDFIDAIEKALDRDDQTRKAWDERRRRFLERNTWAVRANEAIQAIQARRILSPSRRLKTVNASAT